MGKIINKLARKVMGGDLAQALNRGLMDGELKNPRTAELCRQAAAEGIVLLKNDNATLPIAEGEKVAVFGRCAVNYFAVGYGSGGDVCAPYIRNLMEGLIEDGVDFDKYLYNTYLDWIKKPANEPDEGFWGHWPMNFPEMPLSDELVRNASATCEKAVVVIGRAAGEERENVLKEGSYYLTKAEKKMLDVVTKYFRKVAVVMDCGNVIDMSWTSQYGDKVTAIVYAWQGGMESGTALADVLCGKVNPSGHLTDTIAVDYDSIPTAPYFGGKEYNNYSEDIYVGYRYFETFARDKVLYPFGYGLSYTTFDLAAAVAPAVAAAGEQKADAAEEGQKVDAAGEKAMAGTKASCIAKVTNTGAAAGKQVVQIYISAPQGRLGKPAVELAGYKKTEELAPGESCEMMIDIDIRDHASFDDEGITGHKSAFVLEAGTYEIYAGFDCRNISKIGEIVVEADVVTFQAKPALCQDHANRIVRMINKNGKKEFDLTKAEPVDMKTRILENLPEAYTYSGDPITYDDVKAGKASVEDFVAQLSAQELDDISHGEGLMDSKLGETGNAGAFAGITDQLRSRGIPPVITCDGPSGIRIRRTVTLMPCGTALASSFNTELVQQLYSEAGKEMQTFNADMLLAPGMNIHRNPLCGRNFEYYSEDPLVSGLSAAAVVKGLQSQKISACPKHFACNNQETRRNTNDSRVSERALREIYLRNFEIMIREADPWCIMTSYNKINGVWNHYNYDLVTTVLREEWGYKGLIITDWWMQPDKSHEFPQLENDAYRVRAQVDVFMPGADNEMLAKFRKDQTIGRKLLDTYRQKDGITLGEMQRCAINVINLALKVK